MTTAPFLEATLAAQVGPLSLEVALTLGEETLVLAGPNGAGKSSLLAMLLGLRRPDRGRIVRAGETLFDAAAAIDCVPERRGFGWVPQGESLFPHLSALGNVELAVEAREPRLSRQERRARAKSILKALSAIAFAERMPRELSGGERQRIALARALASGPRALLLDEPLGALDAEARPEVRAFLSATLATLRLPALIVTHDAEDAAALAGRIVVLEQGRIAQSGTLLELRQAAATPFVQRFVQPRS